MKEVRMLSIYTHATRDFIASQARSALPDAPVVPVREPAAAAGTRRVLAGALLALADRVSPEPVERSRWQSV
jgi:hypothetical protein